MATVSLVAFIAGGVVTLFDESTTTAAIGDGSVRATLDGYAAVIEARGGNPLRHHIDHCSLVHPDDFQRFVELDVTCTIWPPLNAPLSYNLGAIKPCSSPKPGPACIQTVACGTRASAW